MYENDFAQVKSNQSPELFKWIIFSKIPDLKGLQRNRSMKEIQRAKQKNTRWKRSSEINVKSSKIVAASNQMKQTNSMKRLLQDERKSKLNVEKMERKKRKPHHTLTQHTRNTRSFAS